MDEQYLIERAITVLKDWLSSTQDPRYAHTCLAAVYRVGMDMNHAYLGRDEILSMGYGVIEAYNVLYRDWQNGEPEITTDDVDSIAYSAVMRAQSLEN